MADRLVKPEEMVHPRSAAGTAAELMIATAKITGSYPKFTPAIADSEFRELVDRIVLIKGCDVYGQGFEAGEWGCGV